MTQRIHLDLRKAFLGGGSCYYNTAALHGDRCDRKGKTSSPTPGNSCLFVSHNSPPFLSFQKIHTKNDGIFSKIEMDSLRHVVLGQKKKTYDRYLVEEKRRKVLRGRNHFSFVVDYTAVKVCEKKVLRRTDYASILPFYRCAVC